MIELLAWVNLQQSLIDQLEKRVETLTNIVESLTEIAQTQNNRITFQGRAISSLNEEVDEVWSEMGWLF